MMKLSKLKSKILLSPFLLRAVTFTASLLLMYAGLLASASTNSLLAFAGAFLALTGGQTALWALGIRLEILGNTTGPSVESRPLLESASGYRENIYYDTNFEDTKGFLDKKVQLLTYEMKGRIFAMSGRLLADASTDPIDPLKVRDSEKLNEAVALCQEGYELLDKIPGSAKFMALNNFIFYACILNDISRRHFLLEKARLLLGVGEEHDKPNLILTACGAIIQFSSNSEENEHAARAIFELAKSSRLSMKQRGEAVIYLERFRESRNTPDAAKADVGNRVES